MTNEQIESFKRLVQNSDWLAFEQYLTELKINVQSTKGIDTSSPSEVVHAQVVGRILAGEIIDTALASAGVLRRHVEKAADNASAANKIDKYE